MQPQMLAQVQSLAQQVMANVSQDQLDLDTPCAEWNVGQLIDHMVGAQHWGLSAMHGTEMTENGEGSCQGDWCSTFEAVAAQASDAFCAEGAMEKTVNPGFGDMPAPALLGLMMTDTFQHAWDLAKATGQDTNLSPQMAQGILGGARSSISDSFRSEDGAIFGFEQQAPADATPADQLAAFLGRTV